MEKGTTTTTSGNSQRKGNITEGKKTGKRSEEIQRYDEHN